LRRTARPETTRCSASAQKKVDAELSTPSRNDG
jgi:hypothetical protein